MSDLLVTVCIPTRNRKDLLLRGLEALGRQTLDLDGFEVVIVDDGSSDGTGEALRERTWPFELRVRELAHGGAPAARNAAAAAARASLLAFMDSDVLPCPGWLAAGLAAFKGDDQIGAVEGKTVVGVRDRVSPFTHQTENRKGGRYPSCNFFVRREAFFEVGGFDTAFGGPYFFREDTDLAFRLMDAGWKIPFCGAAIVDHPPIPADLINPLRDARRYRYDPPLRKKHPRRFPVEVDAYKIHGVRIARPRQKAYVANVLLALLTSAVAVSLRFGAPAWAFLAAAVGYGLTYGAVLAAHRPWRIKSLAEALVLVLITPLVPWVYLYSVVEGLGIRPGGRTSPSEATVWDQPQTVAAPEVKGRTV